MNNLSSTAVEGVVTNNNNVWIHRSSGMCPDVDTSTLSSRNQQAVKDNPNLCLVATNAMTAGRQNMPGSTQMTSDDTVFFKRPPSVSFQSSSLPAFVVMNNGRFDFAIIASCGNPVNATPVTVRVKPKVKASTTTVQPTTAPPAPTQSQTQTQSQSQSVTINQPAAPASQAAPAPAAAQPTPAQTLPNTGSGSILGVGSLSAVLGTIGHFIYSRRRASGI